VKVTLCQRGSPGFAVPYHFLIPITGGFAFGHSAETCLHVVYNLQHAALKELMNKSLTVKTLTLLQFYLLFIFFFFAGYGHPGHYFGPSP